MHYVSHGGKCCGINHIHGFSWPNGADSATRALHILNEKIDHVLERRYGFNPTWFHHVYYYYGWTKEQRETERLKQKAAWNTLIECVLTDDQLEAGWEAVLLERGFKLVTRFLNCNSGNYCNVFHLQTAPKKEK